MKCLATIVDRNGMRSIIDTIIKGMPTKSIFDEIVHGKTGLFEWQPYRANRIPDSNEVDMRLYLPRIGITKRPCIFRTVVGLQCRYVCTLNKFIELILRGNIRMQTDNSTTSYQIGKDSDRECTPAKAKKINAIFWLPVTNEKSIEIAYILCEAKCRHPT